MSTLRLITGGIGTGKSLWTVDQAFKLKDEQPDRVVYTDITGIQHTGIISVPADFDWRDAVDNSLIIFDEVQYKVLFSRHNSKRDKQILDLTTIRKRGIELWLITQRARFLNPDVLGLVNEHVHLERKSKQSAKVFIFQEAETSITANKKMFAFKKYVYQYPTHLYGFYQSIKDGAVHHKRSWLHQGIILVIMSLIIAALLGGYTIYKGTNTDITASGVDTKKPTSQTSFNTSQTIPNQPTTQTNQQNSVEKVSYNPNRPYQFDYNFQYEVKQQPQLAGCVIYQNECTCFTQQATKLEMTQKDCKRYMSGDRPFDAFREQAQQQLQQQQLDQQQQYRDQFPPSDPQQFDAVFAEKMRIAKEQGLIK